MVLCVGLRSVIMAFPGHTHLLSDMGWAEEFRMRGFWRHTRFADW